MNGTNTIVDYLTSVPAWYLTQQRCGATSRTCAPSASPPCRTGTSGSAPPPRKTCTASWKPTQKLTDRLEAGRRLNLSCEARPSSETGERGRASRGIRAYDGARQKATRNRATKHHVLHREQTRHGCATSTVAGTPSISNAGGFTARRKTDRQPSVEASRDAFEHVDRGVRLPAFDIDEVLAANAHHEEQRKFAFCVSFRSRPRDIGSELSF